jgi:hypothetical protein
MASAPRIQPLPPLAAVLLGLTVVSTVLVFAWNVWPVLNGAAKAQHPGHWGWVRLHALTGAVLLLTGPLNVYVGQTQRWFDWHRHIGCAYIGAGYTAALAALAVNWQAPHGNPSIALSTSLLALAWMGTASMGWRTGAQKRFRAHSDWMIRSYVLTWSFVFCRIGQRSDTAGLLGPDGGALLVWLTWLVPLLIAELLLRWRATGGTRGGKPAG